MRTLKCLIAVGCFAAALARAAAAPDLALSVSMNIAGGGPDHFSSVALFKALFGAKLNAETSKLDGRFGLNTVSTFFHVSDFAVPDAMNIVQQRNMPLPDNPAPPPEKTKALAAALYHAGLVSGKFQAVAMLDNMLSASVRMQLEGDIDKRFGLPARNEYYAVLTQIMNDLHSVTAGAR